MTREARDRGILEIIQHYGANIQTDKAIEEMAELTKALLKFRTDPSEKNLDGIIEELGDVALMISQLGIIYDCGEDVERVIDRKIKRQIERMESDCA